MEAILGEDPVRLGVVRDSMLTDPLLAKVRVDSTAVIWPGFSW